MAFLKTSLHTFLDKPRAAAAEAMQALAAEKDLAEAMEGLAAAEKDLAEAMQGLAAAKKDLADATRQLEATEALLLKGKRISRRVLLGGGALFLLGDYLWHDWEPLNRWRVKQRLLNYPREAPHGILERAQEPLPVGGHSDVIKVFGPAGSGKTTVLEQLAYEAAHPHVEKKGQGVPKQQQQEQEQQAKGAVMLVKLQKQPGAESADSYFYYMYMQNMLHLTCNAVGYPRDHSLIVKWFGGSYGILPPCERMMRLINTLFDAAREVYYERRAAGMDHKSAKVLLLFDGMETLVADKRLASLGGEAVLQLLKNKLVAACVEPADYSGCRFAHAVLTGSSGALREAFKAVPGSIYQLQDPEEAPVLARLQERGYSEEDARKLVGALGTRVGLLFGPLTVGAEYAEANHYIDSLQNEMARDLAALLRKIPAADAARLTAILNGLAVKPAPYGSLPESVRTHPHFRNILYLQRDGCVCFQSKMVQNAWAKLQSRDAESGCAIM